MVHPTSFNAIRVEQGTRLTIRFDGSGLKLKKQRNYSRGRGRRLMIARNAFHGVRVKEDAIISIEIYEYGHVDLEDLLVSGEQSPLGTAQPRSQVHVRVRDCDELNVNYRDDKFKQQHKVLKEKAEEEEEEGRRGGLPGTYFDDYDEEYEETTNFKRIKKRSHYLIRQPRRILQKQKQHQHHSSLLLSSNQTYSFEVDRVHTLRMGSASDSEASETSSSSPTDQFQLLYIRAHSVVSIALRRVERVFMGESLFKGMIIGPSAQFNLLVERTARLGLGKHLFRGLQQMEFSVCAVQFNQIGVEVEAEEVKSQQDRQKKRRKKKRSNSLNSPSPDEEEEESYDYDYYDDLDYNDDENISSDLNEEEEREEEEEEGYKDGSDWLCVPEGFFENMSQNESAQVHVTFGSIGAHVSVAERAFNELRLGANGKFQLNFQLMFGHVVFDRNAISLIRLGAGLFQVWVEDHRAESPPKLRKKMINEDDGDDKFSSTNNNNNNLVWQMSRMPMNQFKLLNLAINKIYLTSRSLFRFGFVRSRSTLSVGAKSIAGFHVEKYFNFKKSSLGREGGRNYKTKIEFEIEQSPYVNFDFLFRDVALVVGENDNEKSEQKNARFQPTNLDLDLNRNRIENKYNKNIEIEMDDEDAINESPKIIEIDRYMPLMTRVEPLTQRLVDKNNTYEADLAVQTEFCQMHRLRPFMATIYSKDEKNNSKKKETKKKIKTHLTTNLVFFSETLKYSADLLEKSININEDEGSSTGCTSCLLIFLYRTVHRRADFYFVKDHLPACFVNAHFVGDEAVHYQSLVDASDRLLVRRRIDDSFRHYWRSLDCARVTGLRRPILIDDGHDDINDIDNSAIDDTLEDYENLARGCSETAAGSTSRAKLVRHFSRLMMNSRGGGKDAWHSSVEQMCARNLRATATESNRPRIGLKRARGEQKSPTTVVVGLDNDHDENKEHSSGKKKMSSFVATCLLMTALSAIVLFLYVKYKNNIVSSTKQNSCLKIFNFDQSSSSSRLSCPASYNTTATRTSTTTPKKFSYFSKSKFQRLEEQPSCSSFSSNNNNNNNSFNIASPQQQHNQNEVSNDYEYDDEFEMRNDSPTSPSTTPITKKVTGGEKVQFQLVATKEEKGDSQEKNQKNENEDQVYSEVVVIQKGEKTANSSNSKSKQQKMNIEATTKRTFERLNLVKNNLWIRGIGLLHGGNFSNIRSSISSRSSNGNDENSSKRSLINVIQQQQQDNQLVNSTTLYGYNANDCSLNKITKTKTSTKKNEFEFPHSSKCSIEEDGDVENDNDDDDETHIISKSSSINKKPMFVSTSMTASSLVYNKVKTIIQELDTGSRVDDDEENDHDDYDDEEDEIMGQDTLLEGRNDNSNKTKKEDGSMRMATNPMGLLDFEFSEMEMDDEEDAEILAPADAEVINDGK